MTPGQYAEWVAGLRLRTPLQSAVRGAQIGGLLGLPVGAYRYFKSDDPSARDVLTSVGIGAALGGVAGGFSQHRLNAPVRDAFKSQMTDWEATRGGQIFTEALARMKAHGSLTPFADASVIRSARRKAREKTVATALMNAHGDNDVFKLRTHIGY